MCACNIGTDWIEIIGVIVAAIVPVIIMIITLRSEKKKHLEQIAQINERNRIDAMPVFDVDTLSNFPIVSGKGNDGKKIEFEISLRNVGNGTAINPSFVLDDKKRGGIVLPGDATERFEIEKELLTNCYSIDVYLNFFDLYGNRYKEKIVLKLVNDAGSNRVIRDEIEPPIIEEYEDKM